MLAAVEIGGHRYVIDVANRKLCLYTDPESAIDMHAEEAKRMLVSIQGAEWRRHTRRDMWEKRRASVL